MEELLSLKWNNHRSTFIHVLGLLRDKQLYTDVTLACDGKFYSVHKLVLSTCSDYFSAMLDRTNCKNPIIVLKDIKCENLEALLDYMYVGEVNVRQSELSTLIKAAECLRVKGLAVPDDEPPPLPRKTRTAADRPSGQREDTGSNSSPPAKRKRLSDVDEGIGDVKRADHDKQSSTGSSSSLRTNDNKQNISPTVVSSNKHTVQKQADSESSSQEKSSSNQLTLENTGDQQQLTSSINNKVERSNTSDHITEIVKVEEDDVIYDLSNDGDFVKDEEVGHVGDGGDVSNDLPEFLQQQASADSLQAFPQAAFSAPAHLPGNMSLWHGDRPDINFSHLNFGSSELSAQQNTQTGKDEERCKQCGQTFTGHNRRYDLARHVLAHKGGAPFRCPACIFRSTRKESMISHLKKGTCVYQKYCEEAKSKGVTVEPFDGRFSAVIDDFLKQVSSEEVNSESVVVVSALDDVSAKN